MTFTTSKSKNAESFYISKGYINDKCVSTSVIVRKLGLGSEKIRNYNHMGQRAFIVTQSIKKLKAEDKEWALNPNGFKRVSDNTDVDITTLSDEDTGLYYKEEPYTPYSLHQRLIVTYEKILMKV